MKQATFISGISSLQVEVRKQKKFWSFFLLILPFFSVFFQLLNHFSYKKNLAACEFIILYEEIKNFHLLT